MILNPSKLGLLQPHGPTLVVRDYEGGEQGDGEELTPGMRRKSSIELSGKRATLAETGAWTELLRMYVRDLLSFEVDARSIGTHTLQQSTTLMADTMRASDKMDSCNIRGGFTHPADQLCAPQNTQTAAEVHALVAVDTDEQEIARIKMQRAAIKQTAVNFWAPPAKLVKRMARGVVPAPSQDPAVGGTQTSWPLDARRGDKPCCVNGWARGRRLWYRTKQRNSGRQPQLPRLTVVPRSQSLGSKCRSRAHASSAQPRWQRSW